MFFPNAAEIEAMVAESRARIADYKARTTKAHSAWVKLTGRSDITLEEFESLVAFKLLPEYRP